MGACHATMKRPHSSIAKSGRSRVLHEALRITAPGGCLVFVELNDECMRMVRENHPDHAAPADPVRYARALAATPEMTDGRYSHTTIVRSDKESTHRFANGFLGPEVR